MNAPSMKVADCRLEDWPGFHRHTRWLGRSGRFVARCQSTMDEAFRDAAEGAPHGHLVVAGRQEAGRGSRGRQWLTQAHQLTFSFLIRTNLPPAERPTLTLALGLAIARSCDALLGGGRARVKWPNDVLIEGRKLAGILVESRGDGALNAGIGLNLAAEASHDELGATSLAEHGPKLSPAAALTGLLPLLEAHIDAHLAHGAAHTSASLGPYLAWRNEPVRCGDIRGVLIGIAPSGALQIREGTKVREVVAGRLERADS